MGRALALIDRIERQIVAHRRRATDAPELVAAPVDETPEDVLRDREECRDSLATFCKRAWHILEPTQPLKWGWALDAICDHLEAVTAGDIRRLIITVPPGLMKPVWQEEPVFEQSRGRIPLREVKVGDRVLTHRGRFREVTAVHEQGVLPLLKITTTKGRVVRSAPDHPFLTPLGWVQAQHLKPTSVLAAVLPQEGFGSATIQNEEARLLGYLVGDGSTKFKSYSITNADQGVIDDVVKCAKAMKFGIRSYKRTPDAKASVISIKAPDGYAGSLGSTKKGSQSPLEQWIGRHELRGKDSYTKRVPPAVMAGNEEVISNFLGAYWSCDGGVMPRKETGQPRAYADTVGKELATDMQHLLLRLGIKASVYTKIITRQTPTKRQGLRYTCYRITVDGPSTIRFAEKVYMAHTVKAAMLHTATLAEFPRVLAEDVVASIERDGEGECRCLTVDEDHSFTAGDLAVHNSLSTCVFWPSWEWGPHGRPNLKHLAFSYSDKLSTRDNRRCRLLISSMWYRERWGDVFGLTRDQNEKVNFENTKGGWRLAASIGGAGTGLRADRVIIDDPINVKDGNSAPALIEAQLFTDETLPTRLVEPAESSIVWIMQRVHEQDPVGHILARQNSYTHLMLPMEFEPERCCVTTLRPATPTAPAITFVDPRTEDGELLFPERYPQTTVDELKGEGAENGGAMSSYAWSGQMQQRPSPRGGAMLRVDRLQIVNGFPAEAKQLRSWDLAGTKVSQLKKNDPDWTRGALCAFHAGIFYILDMRSIRSTAGEVKTLIKQTAQLDGYRVPVRIPQDAGSGGKSVAEDYVLNVLPGWSVKIDRETGDKVTRADPFVTAVEHGNVRLLAGDWNKDFLAEATTFPFGRHDDQIDAVTGAFVILTQAPPPAPAWSVPLVAAVPIEPQSF